MTAEDADRLVVSATGSRTHALTAEGHDASEDGTGRGTPIVTAETYQKVVRSGARTQTGDLPPDVWAHRDMAATLSPFDLGSETRAVELVVTQPGVRRLTPTECERLQGAPDGWTEGQADSPRYRQLGNAVAVPVFEWVGRRLAAVDATIRVSQETP